MKIILYSTNCPKCNTLKKRLTDKGIPFTENNNIDEMLSMGIDYVPVLFADGELMQYKEAIEWVERQ